MELSYEEGEKLGFAAIDLFRKQQVSIDDVIDIVGALHDAAIDVKIAGATLEEFYAEPAEETT